MTYLLRAALDDCLKDIFTHLNRAWWRGLLAFLGIMTLNLPAFIAMQAFSPVMALPFTVSFIVLMYGSYVAARDYYREELQSEAVDTYISFSKGEAAQTKEAPGNDD